ncbi:MAG: hypothetical protein FGM54_09140, partial [Chitinophagaceae bacterium]|nr:hypothetical protein [Chitinophagaceae bacterium]
MPRYLLLLFLLLLHCTSALKARSCYDTLLGLDSNTVLTIESIHIQGNKTTRDFIMLREMNIQAGDTVSKKSLDEFLEEKRTRLLNMQLFSLVDISVLNHMPGNDSSIEIHIQVREVLYWLPKPIFSLADRNFNVWWVEQHNALNRTNIGFELTRVNFRGRDERINLIMQLGYNKLFNVSYRIPYINKAMTVGVNAGFTWGTGRETFYKTDQNKLLFYANNQYPYKQWQARIGASYRGDYATVHDALLSWNHTQISDSLFALNSNYLGGKKQLDWTELTYSWQYNRTNARVYPT